MSQNSSCAGAQARLFRWAAALSLLFATSFLGQAPSSAAPTFTLAQAIARARANSPDFQAALVAQGIARDDRIQAQAALLPAVNYLNSYLYTQGNRFIANNGVHEYVSQGNAHEDLTFGSLANIKRAAAAQALAQAQTEIAARGLEATVTQDFFTVIAAARKSATATQAVADAQRFLKISQDLETGGEVAHSDVIKAQLELEQKQRELIEAELAATRARLGLAVLLFPTFDQNYTLTGDLDQPPALPPLEQIQALAAHNNPLLAAAEAALTQSRQAVTVAHADLLPTLTLDYWYGIDALDFAARDPRGMPNLGSSAQGTLNIPVWSWGAAQSRLDQARLQQKQAQVELTAAQRQLLADLQSDYAEARAARDALATLATSRDEAAESLRLIGLRYQAGESGILDLVDAQNTLTDARNAYDDGQVRYRAALAALQTLTGAF